MGFYKEEQIKQHNLWIAESSGNHKLLVSYNTIVGWYNYETSFWELTKHKYSPTTSRQLNEFEAEHPCIWVEKLPEFITIHNG